MRKHIFTKKPIVDRTSLYKGGSCVVPLLREQWNKPDFQMGSQMVRDNHDLAPQVKVSSSRPQLAKANLVGGKTNYHKKASHITMPEKPYALAEKQEASTSKALGGTLLNSIKLPQQNIDRAQKAKKNNISFSV
jgi:hypothetical protein